MRKTLTYMVLAAVVAGCSGQNRTDARKSGPNALPVNAIARIDGQPIDREKLIAPLIEAYGLNVLLSLAQLEVAKKAVADKSLSVTPSDIEAEKQLTFKKMFAEAQPADYPELLEQFLRQQRLTRQEFDLLIQTNAYMRALARPTIAGRINDEALQQAFNALYGETVKVRHIQCANIAEINEVRRRMADGGSFEDVAKMLSRNPRTAPLGGEMPTFSRATLDIPQGFKDTAFNLKEGEISDPVQAAGSYHLIRLDQRIAPKAVKFEDVKDSVRQTLEEQAMQQQINAIRASIGQHVVQSLDIQDPGLRAEFQKKMTQGENEIRDRKKIDEQLERERAAAATQPTTANATMPAGEPPATAASPTTAPTTHPIRP